MYHKTDLVAAADEKEKRGSIAYPDKRDCLNRSAAVCEFSW